MAALRVVRVPHRARRSFDVASCPCGWARVQRYRDENLDFWVAEHNEAYEGHYVELEEFVPEGES